MKAWVLALLAAVATAVVFHFNSALTFNLWDNFETFTPNTLLGHSLWLKGEIPILNLQQSLGVPMMGNAQSGLLYFPHTLTLALLKIFNLDPQLLPEFLGVFHLSVAVMGWATFFTAFGIRWSLAVVAAVGLSTSGVFIMGMMIWQHIGSEYSWFPWLLWALLAIIRGQHVVRASALFSLFWFLCASGSHVQQLIYISLNLVGFAFVVGLTERPPGLVHRMGVAFVWMVTLTLPAFCYSLAIRSEGQRAVGLPSEIFFEGSLNPLQLIGFLTPFHSSGQTLFGTPMTWFASAGLLLPLGLSLLFRQWRSSYVIGFALLAVLFLDFSLGENGLIYPLTHVIPIWSSFRWPYKFVPHLLTMMMMLAVWIVNREWSRIKRPFLLALILGFWLGPLLFVQPESWAAGFFWLAQGLMLLALVFAERFVVLGAVIAVSSALWWSTEQRAHLYHESYGAYGSEYYSMPELRQCRLAPLSYDPCHGQSCQLQRLSQLDAASANDYMSVSGHQMGMSAAFIGGLISANAWGVISPTIAELAVARPLYRSLSVCAYLVSSADVPAYQSLLLARGLSIAKQTPDWTLYREANVSPPVFVPRQVRVRPDTLGQELFMAGLDLAYVDSWSESSAALTAPEFVKIDQVQWRGGRGIEFRVASPGPAFVVASIYPWPFLKATVDGKVQPILRANILSSGVLVPAGQHDIQILASSEPLFLSLLLAGFTLLLGLWWMARVATPRSSASE